MLLTAALSLQLTLPSRDSLGYALHDLATLRVYGQRQGQQWGMLTYCMWAAGQGWADFDSAGAWRAWWPAAKADADAWHLTNEYAVSGREGARVVVDVDTMTWWTRFRCTTTRRSGAESGPSNETARPR